MRICLPGGLRGFPKSAEEEQRPMAGSHKWAAMTLAASACQRVWLTILDLHD